VGVLFFELNNFLKQKLKIFLIRKKKHLEKCRKEIKESRKIVKTLK